DFGPGGLVPALAEAAGGRPATARDLFGVVWDRLPAGASDPPGRVLPAFLRLRRELVAECGVERGRVRPSARLDDLIPKRGRAIHWERLGERLGRPLPELGQP